MNKLLPFMKPYTIGAVFVGSMIMSGNLCTVAFLTNDDPDVSFFLAGAALSVAKGVTYGAIWPVFVPYALLKATRPPRYIRCKLGRVNDNGFRPHFVPGWNLATGRV